ncbi:NAD(P)/FAD-dependent oxidoreductase [Wenxinia saemankumensis]|uniref:Cytochrome-dependent sulfide dehydrogenase (Flavoprotein) n=1 Tax=Wenxinia saemankumensis TaxID=1447782 RepID=A0A1M6FLK7_9RHOB|nr:NAD(P)/FAD-dependent oxidoreductase [Wenxinia saemankumensis]SHI98608.1 cytochrome-dependent sulfide dehydrogenase (flavoprotein) [Wenxinia saemankumensis]
MTLRRTIHRRGFLGGTIAAASTLSAPMVMGAAHGGMAKVVVVGGGAGGATAARYIARDSAGAVEVTLIEPSRDYYTCFFSNLYLGGFREIDTLRHSYGTLASEYGINVVHDWVTGIDRDARTVSTANGATLPYDRLVLSPGIDFKDGAVPGWDVSAQNAMPHAYKAGSQTELLRAQVLAMPEGGTFAMVAPPNPYRCPPGPYERVSMVAHVLRETNPTAKILIADPKESFSKQGLFEEGWQTHYPGMIERIGPEAGGGNLEVDPAAMTLTIDGEAIPVDVCNVIPAMTAGRIVQQADLTGGGDWAPVSAYDLSSTVDPAIHVLGDSAAQGEMPKSGFAANSQAKVAANAIVAELTGSTAFPARFSNTCWSLIDTEDGVKVGATYEATDEGIKSLGGFVSETGESEEVRAATYRESLGWYTSIITDMFG